MSQFIERERAAVSLAIATVTMIAAQVVTFIFNHRSKNIIIHREEFSWKTTSHRGKREVC